MKKDNKKSGNRKKKAAGITALVLALLLLMGGTFAWYTMASALNEFEHEAQGAVLHDDFLEAKSGDTESNKDVYVENTGDEELFVRVKLTEYFEINGEPQGDASADKEDKDSWAAHTGTTSATEDVFHEYWQWKMGGNSIEYEKAPLFMTGTMKRYDEDGNDTLASATNKGWTNNNQQSEVITMNAYADMTPAEQAVLEACWILDNTDGYAYWSEKLIGGETTGLLLDSVTRIKDLEGRYYYGINVEMESVDEEDLLAWLNGTTTQDGKVIPKKASENAQVLLKNLSNQYVHHNDLTAEFGVDPSDSTYAEGGYLDKDAQKRFEAEKLKRMKAEIAGKAVGATVEISKKQFIVASNDGGGQVELLLLKSTEKAVFGSDNIWANSTIKTTINEQGYIDRNVPEILQSIMVEKVNTPSDTTDKDKMYLMSKTTAEKLFTANASAMEDETGWWLITGVDSSSNKVYFINEDGSIDEDGAIVTGQRGIRPVFTVDTN